MKVVINRCYGGFSVSKKVYKKLGLKSGYLSNVDFGIESNNYNAYRAHPKLIKTGEYAKLDIVEIPDDVDWTIEEYDGREWISEKHRTW